MLEELFSPDPQILNFEEIEFDADVVVVKVMSAEKEVACPYCQMAAYRMHSRYIRTLDDLPCGERRVKIQWKTRRFFCDNQRCPYLTFCERLPQVARYYARKTKRLQEKQAEIGWALGGEAGKRLACQLNIPISADQLIHQIQFEPGNPVPTPRVLGIDDWAMRKGQTYGTILVDLEEHQVIDLLPDRKPETVAEWLKAHPGIQIICRDRGKEYIQGVALGEQDVIEIADRFHLLKNMVELLQRLLEHHPDILALAAKHRCLEGQTQVPDQQPPAPTTIEKTEVQPASVDQKCYQQVRFEEMKSLHQQGLSQRAIAEKTGLARQTVRKYLYCDQRPKRQPSGASGSKAAPFLNFIQQQWDPEQPNVKSLFEKLQERGFTGSYASVNRLLHSQLGVQNLKTTHPAKPKTIRVSPRQAAWAIFRPEEDRKAAQTELCLALCAVSPLAVQAHDLAHEFRTMIRDRQPDCLDGWLQKAENSQINEFVQFAAGLRSDYKAIRAALSYSWSSGQVEGQVNRLKLIKRQMYGRAGLSLLRSRVIGPFNS
jgi:transposase